SVPVFVAIPAWAVAGLGMGLAYSMPSLVVLADAAPTAVGEASAALVLTDVLGVALGTGVGGALVAMAAHSGWARSTGIAMVDVAAAAVGLAALAITHRLPGRRAAGTA